MRIFLTRIATLSLFVAAFFACSSDEPTGAPADDGPSTEEDGSVSPSKKDASADAPVVKPGVVHVTLTNETQSFDGKTRSYILGVPDNYDENKSYPLVLNFHGNPGSATGQAAYQPFESVSEGDAIVAYPQATTDDWDLFRANDDNADMNWIHQLPAEIAAKVNIDTSKVFGFGYSGGGYFLTEFTCRFGDVFKAVSSNAGGGPMESEMGYDYFDNGCPKCPGGPVAMLITHGELDDPGSGEFTKKCFATYNGCSTSSSDTTPASCKLADDCMEGRPVKWCIVPGLGHGAWDQSMDQAWAFFQAQL